MPRAFFEDFEVGERRTTDGRTITEADIGAFAGLSGDWHPLHTDAVFAAEGPHGERTAHSLFVLSVGAGLLSRQGFSDLLPQSFLGLEGIKNARFLAPVRIGDTLHLATRVETLAPLDPEQGVVTTRNDILNQDDDLVCSFDLNIICRRQPA